MLLFNNFDPIFLVGLLLTLVIAVTVHEFAHNYVAHLMGDPGPQLAGKLTLNPLAHVWWQGWIIFMLIGFAPLGFAQINPRAMRNPRWGYFAAVAAGPFSNLLLAVFFAPFFRLFASGPVAGPVEIFLYLSVVMNIVLFVFNLIPLFPLDGWTVAYTLLPGDLAVKWDEWKQYSQYVLFGAIALSFISPSLNILGPLINGPVLGLSNFLLG